MKNSLLLIITSFALSPLAFSSPGIGAPASVPTLDIWGLLIMIGGLGAVLGFRQWRARQRRDK